MRKLKRAGLIAVSRQILKLASHYKGAPHREMRIDGLVYGVLNIKYSVTRQHHVRSNTSHPKRIDFRQGGSAPVVVEMVLRTEENRNEAYGSQNRDELHKLERQATASLRFLLILDVANSPIDRTRLETSYEKIKRSRGRGVKRKVRVVYVHATRQYHFLWPVRRRASAS